MSTPDQSTKYSPGPWNLPGIYNLSDTYCTSLTDLDGRKVATITLDEDPARSCANAKLMAAAPEMLAALRRVPLASLTDDNLGWRCAGCGSVSGINPDGSDRDEDCAPDCYVAAVEVAIAKATGETK